MGTYRHSVYEIAEAIQDGLCVLEGEVFKEDFQKACDKVLKEYDYWSDDDE